MNLEFKYLGKFNFIFENILGNETGFQTGSINEQILLLKISYLCTFYQTKTRYQLPNFGYSVLLYMPLGFVRYSCPYLVEHAAQVSVNLT